MKANKVMFKRLYNLGDYQHAEIGIELFIEPGEKAVDVLKQAVDFVEKFNPTNPKAKRIKEINEILSNPENYNYGVVEAAKTELKNINNELNNDMPF